MSTIKSIATLFITPIFSSIGFIYLDKYALKSDSPKWKESFNNKNVLIVGSGPSLDKVSEEYFSSFDVIIYLNHAIKLAEFNCDQYFFSTDIKVVLDIQRKPYFKNIIKLGKDKSIIAPGNFNQSLFLSNEFKHHFSWIRANNAVFKKYPVPNIMKFGFQPSLFYYRPASINTTNLDTWFSQKEQVKYFPIFEKTTALTAILFAAKYKPKNIKLIGCDFSAGRSASLKKDNHAYVNNPFEGAKNLYLFLADYLFSKGINIQNDSWIK